MAAQIISYDVKPTNLIPNSPKPLLLYKGCCLRDGKVDVTLAFDTLKQNGWTTQWVAQYGHYQRSHYHATAHEAMIVLSGPGKIRWGTADFGDDPEQHTYGTASEDGALYTDANVGDVFIVPAGVTHKSYDPNSTANDARGLTEGGNHGIQADDPRKVVGDLEVSGFVMMGAYPHGVEWGWSEGGDHVGRYESVWNVKMPDLDPFFGANGGINDYWKRRQSSL